MCAEKLAKSGIENEAREARVPESGYPENPRNRPNFQAIFTKKKWQIGEMLQIIWQKERAGQVGPEPR